MIDATLLVRVTGEMKAWLDDLSRTSGVPRAEIVRRALGAVMSGGDGSGSGSSDVAGSSGPSSTGGGIAAAPMSIPASSHAVSGSASSKVNRSRLPRRPTSGDSESPPVGSPPESLETSTASATPSHPTHVHRGTKMKGAFPECECGAHKAGNRWV